MVPLAAPTATATTALSVSERRIVGMLALVQFVNVLDFMMVMPLGPDLARDLGVETSRLGLVGGSYTAAAAVSGLVSAFFIDRVPRKKALIAIVFALALATFAGAFATGLRSLLLARVFAGLFGGPATALALAMVADAVPVARRGRALGVVMGAFSIASIVGVPVGLELARFGSWRTPFLGVGLLTLLTVVGVHRFMKDQPSTERRGHFSLAKLWAQVRDTDSALSLLLVAVIMFSSFLVVPNIASYVQRNLGLPRERVGLMYLSGGSASLIAMQVAGRAVDRYGARAIATIGTFVAILALYFGFANHLSWFHPVLISTLFMAGTSVRAIATNTLTSRVPQPNERGAFMSVQSTMQHLASACGAFVSSKLLASDGSGRLIGIDKVAVLAIALSLAAPLLVVVLERRINRRQRS